MPGPEGVLTVRAVSGSVLDSSTVPLHERTAVDTGNLVVGHGVILRFVLEPLHGQKEQVPLIGILLHVADLQTRILAIGSTGGDDLSSTRHEHGSSVLEMGLHGFGGSVGRVHVGIVREGDGDLEKNENGEQHAHEAVGLAEGGHVGATSYKVCCRDGMERKRGSQMGPVIARGEGNRN